ncbi:polysaccharide biosynthesis C-terminal domain-containing protein, partial [Candidatus Falkowbacteria bacterium]|nr:polysaccharide biosynthesis C-terminal domain-containing protein [Candidatus Falkowbacteria bacterium]
ALQILIIATGIIFINVVFGYAIVVIKQQKTMLLGYVTTAIVALSLYLILIPRYSFVAAAWITVLAEAMMLAMNYFVATKVSGVRVSITTTLKALLAAGIMGIVVYQITSLPLVVIVLCAAAIYGGILAVTGVITKELLVSLVSKNS